MQKGNVKVNYEVKCRRCGNIEELVGLNDVPYLDTLGWKEIVMSRPEEQQCQVCERLTLNDVVAFMYYPEA